MRLRTLVLLLSLCSTTLSAKTLDTCFSPVGHCDQVMVSWINSALHTLDGAIYGLTDENIAQALIRAHQRGVRVRVVHDRTQSAGKNDVSSELISAGIPIHIQRGSQGGILHDKFLVIDSSYVITGSFNWTNNATQKNDENFVVLDDQAPRFEQEFERLWSLPSSNTIVTPGHSRLSTHTRASSPRILVMPVPVPVLTPGPAGGTGKKTTKKPPKTHHSKKHPRKKPKKKAKPQTQLTPGTSQ